MDSRQRLEELNRSITSVLRDIDTDFADAQELALEILGNVKTYASALKSQPHVFNMWHEFFALIKSGSISSSSSTVSSTFSLDSASPHSGVNILPASHATDSALASSPLRLRPMPVMDNSPPSANSSFISMPSPLTRPLNLPHQSATLPGDSTTRAPQTPSIPAILDASALYSPTHITDGATPAFQRRKGSSLARFRSARAPIRRTARLFDSSSLDLSLTKSPAAAVITAASPIAPAVLPSAPSRALETSMDLSMVSTDSARLLSPPRTTAIRRVLPRSKRRLKLSSPAFSTSPADDSLISLSPVVAPTSRRARPRSTSAARGRAGALTVAVPRAVGTAPSGTNATRALSPTTSSHALASSLPHVGEDPALLSGARLSPSPLGAPQLSLASYPDTTTTFSQLVSLSSPQSTRTRASRKVPTKADTSTARAKPASTSRQLQSLQPAVSPSHCASRERKRARTSTTADRTFLSDCSLADDSLLLSPPRTQRARTAMDTDTAAAVSVRTTRLPDTDAGVSAPLQLPSPSPGARKTRLRGMFKPSTPTIAHTLPQPLLQPQQPSTAAEGADALIRARGHRTRRTALPTTPVARITTPVAPSTVVRRRKRAGTFFPSFFDDSVVSLPSPAAPSRVNTNPPALDSALDLSFLAQPSPAASVRRTTRSRTRPSATHNARIIQAAPQHDANTSPTASARSDATSMFVTAPLLPVGIQEHTAATCTHVPHAASVLCRTRRAVLVPRPSSHDSSLDLTMNTTFSPLKTATLMLPSRRR